MSMQLPKCDVICKTVEINSPIHRKFRGYRLIAVIPNLAGRKMYDDEPKISFAVKYRVLEVGDLMSWPTKKQIERFERQLRDKFSSYQDILWVD